MNQKQLSTKVFPHIRDSKFDTADFFESNFTNVEKNRSYCKHNGSRRDFPGGGNRPIVPRHPCHPLPTPMETAELSERWRDTDRLVFTPDIKITV